MHYLCGRNQIGNHMQKFLLLTISIVALLTVAVNLSAQGDSTKKVGVEVWFEPAPADAYPSQTYVTAYNVFFVKDSIESGYTLRGLVDSLLNNKVFMIDGKLLGNPDDYDYIYGQYTSIKTDSTYDKKFMVSEYTERAIALIYYFYDNSEYVMAMPVSVLDEELGIILFDDSEGLSTGWVQGNSPTGIENVAEESDFAVKKVIHEGRIYIERNGELFDMYGRRVR